MNEDQKTAIEIRTLQTEKNIHPKRSAEYIFAMTREFVSERHHREYREFLLETFIEKELELSNGQQRKEYEAIKQTMIDLPPTLIVFDK